MPTKERRQYNIKSTDPVKFYDHEGKEITVFDLRKNMKIKATKITEAPRIELVQNIAVTGTAPTQAAAAAPAGGAETGGRSPGSPGGRGVPDGVHTGSARDAEDAAQDGEPPAVARPDRPRVAGGRARPHRAGVASGSRLEAGRARPRMSAARSLFPAELASCSGEGGPAASVFRVSESCVPERPKHEVH